MTQTMSRLSTKFQSLQALTETVLVMKIMILVTKQAQMRRRCRWLEGVLMQCRSMMKLVVFGDETVGEIQAYKDDAVLVTEPGLSDDERDQYVRDE